MNKTLTIDKYQTELDCVANPVVSQYKDILLMFRLMFIVFVNINFNSPATRFKKVETRGKKNVRKLFRLSYTDFSGMD